MTPLIGMAQDDLASFEPTFADELACLMEWAFEYMQRGGRGHADTDWQHDVAGGAVYFRLSTRAIRQDPRPFTAAVREGVITGGYWLREPAPGAELAIVYTGAVAPEALAVWEEIHDDIPGAGLLAVTSADRLNAGWHAAERARAVGRREIRCQLEQLLEPLAADAGLVTVVDGHLAVLSWIGAVAGHPVRALGVEHFGQSGDLVDLYRHYRIDTEAILDACAAACIARFKRRQARWPMAAE